MERTPSKDEPLRMAAPLRITCALPERGVAESLASGYRANYEVLAESGQTPRVLDAGAEVHTAPDGASQAIERVYVHLRHRWYPAATAVTVTHVDVLPPAAFPGLPRHFSVVVEGVGSSDLGLESTSSLPAGWTKLPSGMTYARGLAIGETVEEARGHSFRQ